MAGQSVALALALVMCLTLAVPAFASDQTSFPNHNEWDYDLAMEKGYLTYEDRRPSGITLKENEIFIPAEVPSPVHAQAILEMNSVHPESRGLGADPWKQYSWEYTGCIQSNTMLDAVTTGAFSFARSVVLTLLKVPAEYSITASTLLFTSDALDYIGKYGMAMGYYNNYLYSAKNPGMFPYIDYSITYMYSDPSRIPAYHLDTLKDWEYALLP